MLKWAIGIVAAVVVVAGLGGVVAYGAGVRVFVVQPIGAIPDGITIVVSGAPGLNAIDSPDAFCQRTQGSVTLMCRLIAVGAVSKHDILFRLPYYDWLYGLTGAPAVVR